MGRTPWGCSKVQSQLHDLGSSSPECRRARAEQENPLFGLALLYHGALADANILFSPLLHLTYWKDALEAKPSTVSTSNRIEYEPTKQDPRDCTKTDGHAFVVR